MIFAVLIYPARTYLMGHRYPAFPTFGLPCPTTLFTIGLLVFLVKPYPRSVLMVPVHEAAHPARSTNQRDDEPPAHFFGRNSLMPCSILPSAMRRRQISISAIATASTSGPSTKPLAPKAKTLPSTLMKTGTVWMRSLFLTSSG